MKKWLILGSIIIVIIIVLVFAGSNKTEDTREAEVTNKSDEMSLITKENFSIDKLYLHKCETVIADKKTYGIRFNIDYTYISSSVLDDDKHNIKINIIYPKELFDLLGVDSGGFEILCTNKTSSRTISINYEVYPGGLSESDIDSFISKQNDFRITLYEEDNLIYEIRIVNTIHK